MCSMLSGQRRTTSGWGWAVSDDLRADLDGLGRLSTDLRVQAAGISQGASAQVSQAVDAAIEQPSAAVCRVVSGETIPGLAEVFGDRLAEVADLVDVARTLFTEESSDRAAVVTSAGSLLPDPRA